MQLSKAELVLGPRHRGVHLHHMSRVFRRSASIRFATNALNVMRGARRSRKPLLPLFLALLLALTTADTGSGGVPLALEAPVEGTAGVRKLRFGEKVALDELGPVLVNSDCTLRRISNWDSKLPHEKQATQARVAQRNAVRLERCRQLEAEGLLPEEGGEVVDDRDERPDEL